LSYFRIENYVFVLFSLRRNFHQKSSFEQLLILTKQRYIENNGQKSNFDEIIVKKMEIRQQMYKTLTKKY